MGSSRLLPLAISVFLFANGAEAAVDPAPRGTPAAVGEQILWASREFIKFTEPLGLPEAVSKRLAVCERAPEALQSCSGPALNECADALQESFAASTQLRDSEAPATDRASGARLATESAEALHLLRTMQASFAQGHCDSMLSDGSIPAHVRLLGDGRTLRLRPIVPLRMGRAYSLELIGATTQDVLAARKSVFPRPTESGLEVPRGTFALPMVQSLPAHGENLPDRTGATNLLRQMEDTVRNSASSKTPTVAGLQLRWPTTLSGDDFQRLRFRFQPQRRSDPENTVLNFSTRNDRKILQQIREELQARPCAPIQLKVAPGAKPPNWPDGDIYEGVVPSVRADPDQPEFPPEPAVSFRLAVPRGFNRDTPLVLLVHGHSGSSERALRKHGSDLLHRKMAALAMDLPDHGRRGGHGERFFDPTDPEGLAIHVRQSAMDVVAVVDTILRCGFRQPNTWEWKPREVRYLGYSVGAMVGILARSIEPRIGTTVLLAAGGDLPGWMMLHTPQRFHPKLLSCVGGPDSGRACLGSSEVCGPPGRCGVDPFLFQLGEQFSLPFSWAAAGGEPLAFATERTGNASRSDVLIFTGGNDYTLHPLLATRLGDALGLGVVAPRIRKGPGGLRVQRPELGHELREDPLVRQESANFLASEGRQRPWIPFP